MDPRAEAVVLSCGVRHSVYTSTPVAPLWNYKVQKICLEDVTSGPWYFLQKVTCTKLNMLWKRLDMQAPVWEF